MKAVNVGAIQRIYCNTCKVLTKHELVYSCERELTKGITWDDQPTDTEAYELWTYLLWICRGCETTTLQEDYVSFEGNTPKDFETMFYPRRAKESLPLKVFVQLNDKLSQIYREVIESFNYDAKTLCAIGLRALLEGVCAQKGVEGKTLYQKIDGLKDHLPSNIVESLHQFRFIGNEAAHDLQAPSRDDLRIAIEVMEDILNFLYELDYKARLLFTKSGISTLPVVKPDIKVIKQMIERNPPIPPGQKGLYKALYTASNNGLTIPQLAVIMERTESQIYGVLGALGRRINNTQGVEGTPGINYILEYFSNVGPGADSSWGWKMRPEMRQVLKTGGYDWAKDWIK